MAQSGIETKEDADERFVTRYLKVVCQFKPLLRLLLSLEILFLLLGGLSFLYGDLEKGSFVILTVTLVTDGVVLLSTIGLIYACRTVSNSEGA